VNCPVLCGIPCEFKSESPSKSPAYKDSEISQSNKVPAPKEPSLRIIITLSILCGVIVVVIIAASFGYSIQKTDGNFAEATRKTDDDFVEDKPKSAVHVVHTPISFKGSPSYVPSDRCNLGLVHSAQDVQCCQNFPCDVCRRGEHVTFVPAKRKGWMSRRNKTGHHTCSRDEAERDVYLDDSASEATDDFDYW